MLEVHRWRQIEWGPSAVVALATSVDGTVVAAARESGAIELWNVAPGSAGWYCHLTIPGKEDAAISSLVWCKSSGKEASSLGRLFSGGLDGFITEWDLPTLQPKGVVESHGGSIWQLAAEPLAERAPLTKIGNGNLRLQNGAANYSDDSSASSDSGSDSEDEDHIVREEAEQRVAVACDDGCVRLFAVSDSEEGMVYRRSFPRLKGRILSVAWSADGSKIFSGGSNGCIHCWDSFQIRELFRITAGIGGVGGGSELCVWSLLTLRDGTIVSGDSTGSTQFWEGKHGTLLQAHAKHGADVLALAAAPSHRGVFAAGADGQVVLYQHVDENQSDGGGNSAGRTDVAAGALIDKWIYVGSKRVHTHDVRALAVAFPRERQELGIKKVGKQNRPHRIRHNVEKRSESLRWVDSGTAMLISGGNDSKLFTYPANAFLAFHPHDVCSAPERPHIQLASEGGPAGSSLFMAQHSNWVDVWSIHANSSSISDMKDGLDFSREIYGKRKYEGAGSTDSRKSLKTNGTLTQDGNLTPNKVLEMPISNGNGGHSTVRHSQAELARAGGISPRLLARIKCKSSEHICCSAVSPNGKYVAFSDRLKPRLYRLDLQNLSQPSAKKIRDIVKRKLPIGVPAAQRMQFTSDCTRLLLGTSHHITVIDVEAANVVHSFALDAAVESDDAASTSFSMNAMCTSADSQWLAAVMSCGRVHIFNLETLRLHWSVPVLDESAATCAVFRHSTSNVLIISTSSSQIHVLDVEAKELSEWSAMNGPQMARHMMDFRGSIIGLSVPPSPTSTSVIAYSARAMCKIDFSKPLLSSKDDVREDEPISKAAARKERFAAHKGHDNGNANGAVEQRSNGVAGAKSNFVVVPFKDPVLFLGHTTTSSLLVVEKPWLEVLKKFPAPVFRHLYGT